MIEGWVENGTPSPSTRPVRRTRYSVAGFNGLAGVKRYSPALAPGSSRPSTAGSIRSAARTAATGIARSSLIVKPVSVRARPLSIAVAAIVAVPAGAVRTTARTGVSSRPPASERALVSMVTVYSVSGCQCAVGAMVSCLPAASHETLTALSGDDPEGPGDGGGVHRRVEADVDRCGDGVAGADGVEHARGDRRRRGRRNGGASARAAGSPP